MWLSDRRSVLAGLGALALTSGCGFRPVFGAGGSGEGLRGQVRVDDPASRGDFNFVAAFEDLLGRPESARYALAYTIARREIGGGVVQNFGATRVQIFATLDYTISDAATGTQRAAGQVRANTVYSTTSTQLSTHTAAEDADLRLMRMLAEALVTRLYTEPGLTTA